MNDQTIKCPKCATEIKLNDALTSEIRDKLENELGKEVSKQAEELRAKEVAMKQKEEEMDKSFAKKIDEEKHKLWGAAQEAAGKQAAEKYDTELKDLKKANEEKSKRLNEMQEQELALRKQKRELEEKEKSMKLDMERKMDSEREKISNEAKKDAAESARLKVAEKDKQIDQMKRALEDAQRRAEQGSMQIQGDVQENDLKNILQNTFPIDTIIDVPAGVRGADLIQTVNTSLGKKAGIILWESKNTKTWSGDWIKKLKDDQTLVKADICILISRTLPDDIKDFAFKGGVWVCSYKSVLSLTSALRMHLTQLNQAKQSLVGKDQKMEILYDYLSGNEFKNSIDNIVSAFSSMHEDLETEKRSMQRIWRKREKEITRVIINTSGMYGDLQGIIGASLPSIPSLEMPEGDSLPDVDSPSGEGN